MLQLSFAKVLKLDITYVGFWYVNWHKRSFFAIAKRFFLALMSEKFISGYFWRWGGVSLFLKTKKITQSLSYHTMAKLTSLSMKAAAAAKKKSGKWDRAQYFYHIVLYFVPRVSFSCAGTSLLPFFDEQRHRNARVDCVNGPCFLMSFLYSFHKKGVPSSPTILVGSAASTLTTTSLSLTKARICGVHDIVGRIASGICAVDEEIRP